jgi:membrane protein DedA with SNARE-associated domain
MDLIPTAPYLPFADSVISDLVRWLIGVPEAIFHGYASILEWAADSIRDLFDKYGYLVIFLGTLCENTLLLGLVVPGVIVVLLAGINSHDGGMNPIYAALLGSLGAIIGDTISYFMGRFGWARLGRGESMRAFSEKVREPLIQRGAFFVLVYHFAGYTRLFGPTAAGLLRMPYRKWAPLDHVGATIWVSSFIGIGYGLGAAGITLDSTDSYFRYIEWGLLAIIAVWLTLLFRSSQKAILGHIADAWRDLEGRDDGGEDRGDAGGDEADRPPPGGDDEPETEVVGSSRR